MGLFSGRKLAVLSMIHLSTRWWFQIFSFSSLFEEDFHFDQYFSDGVETTNQSMIHLSSMPLDFFVCLVIFLRLLRIPMGWDS